MFTIVDSLILRPVPFRDPEQLAHVWMGTDRGGRLLVDPEVVRAWRESPAFDGAESAMPETALLETGQTVVTRGLAVVTPGVFDLLGGVRPVHGRLFDPAEGRAGLDDRLLVSETVWRTLYGADPGLLERTITVNGERLIVVGILPAEFRFPSAGTVLWRPTDLASRPGELARAYVRFASGMPRDEALRLATGAARAADAANASLRARVSTLAGMTDDYSRRAVPALAGGVGLVFLVLCANVCGLLLARLTARRREFSMRAALGASRGRLIRQTVVESGLLGTAGVLLAVIAAAGGLFSVLSYAVSRRRREFGIRAALGASRSTIRRVVLRDAVVIAGAGLVLGTVGAAWLARVLGSLQYGITPHDPVTWSTVPVLLALIVLAASWVPARAAARVDPLVLLREE